MSDIDVIAINPNGGSPAVSVTSYRKSWTATQASLGAVAAVHAAVTDNGSARTITTSITNPACARSITATAGGTSADVKAITVTVTGTDINGAVISEVLPAFTVNTTGTVEGNKAFKTVTSITIPAHDGTGATTSIGTGAKLGLDHMLDLNSVESAFLGGTKEGTAPTVAVSSSAVCSNTVSLNSALNGTAVDIFYKV